jgi:cytochrome P450
MRRVLKLLRRLAPIWVVGRRVLGAGLTICKSFSQVVFVTRHADVVEVLRRNEVFSVALYDLRMRAVLGPFVLGMDDTPVYRHEVSALREAMRPDDLDRIRALAARRSREIVAKAVERRALLDLVGDLGDVVTVDFVGDYFGIPEPKPEAPVLIRWFQTVSFCLFTLDFLTDARLQVAAGRAGKAIGAHIESCLRAARERAQAGTPPDHVLGRLLAMQADPQTRLVDERIRDTLGGTLSGALVPTSSQFADAANRLLDLPPAEFARLQAACREGNDDLVWRYLREASRFLPFPPALYRYCERETVLAAGTLRAKRIPEGSIVLVSTLSAAFDEEVVRDPEAFRVDRPDHEYLLFGAGQHFCLGASDGRWIAQTLMTEMAKPLFALKGLRRVPGPAGRLAKRRGDEIPPNCAAHLFVEYE